MRKTIFWSTKKHFKEWSNPARRVTPAARLWYGVTMVLGWHLLNFPLGLLALALFVPEMMSLPGVLQYTLDIFPSFLGVTQLVYVAPMIIYLMARFSPGVLRGVLLAGCLTCIFSLVYYLGIRISVLEYLANSGLV